MNYKQIINKFLIGQSVSVAHDKRPRYPAPSDHLRCFARLFGYGLAVFISIFFTTISATPASALSESTLDYYNINGIYYYDPDGASSNCANSTTGTYDGSASAGLSELQAAFVDTYHDIAESLSIQYGIPWETVMAQGILESAAGTSNFAVNRNNFFGIGAFDSTPDNAYSYDTPEEGWQGYYENIRKTSTYREHGAFNYPDDPYGYLEAIKAAGYATSSDYVSSVSALIAAIENRAAEKGWLTSAELVEKYPEMKENAEKNQAGTTTDEDYSSTELCVGEGNGDINATAIALAWPDRSHDPTDPKEEYAAALEATGVSQLGDTCSMGGYSCDAFVATVMRYSGVDPDFPCCGAANQLNYLANSDKYEEIENLGNSSNMQPGDIRSKSSHIELYVQAEDGNYYIASASHCDRTADYGIPYYADSEFRIFRYKGGE